MEANMDTRIINNLEYFEIQFTLYPANEYCQIIEVTDVPASTEVV